MSTKKPVVLVVMDGVGFSKTGLGDAVSEANTPTLDMLLKEYPPPWLILSLFSDELYWNVRFRRKAIR